jgi:hypothetical protein
MKNPTEADVAYDEYLDVVYRHWDDIFRLYAEFEEKRPVMLFDIQEKRIYAYPYEDFKAELSENSRISLTEQYEEAQQAKTVVLFIRDNDRRKLVSYTISLGENRRKGRRKKNTVVFKQV